MYNITMSFIVAAMFALAPQAQASSTPWNPSIDGLSNPGENGAEIFSLNDTDGVNDDFTATLLIERAGFAPHNTFGIYDINSMAKLEIFSGPDHPTSGLFPTSKTISWNSGNASINGGISSVAINQNSFGFYITTPQDNGYTYYSEAAKNIDNSFDHLLTYNMDGLGGFDYLLAWEDLFGGGDQDFADMVVGITDVSAVPLPAAVWFFGTALLGLVSVGRRKQIPFA